jgi:hypothetical protein
MRMRQEVALSERRLIAACPEEEVLGKGGQLRLAG